MQGSKINSILTIEYMCNEKETQNFVDTQLREFTHLGTAGEFVTVPEYPKFAWEERYYKCSNSS